MKVSLTLGLLATSEAAKAVRAPSKRAQKNQEFLETWFSKNCKTREGDGEDAVRPNRCDNKFHRYMTEWDKLQASFGKCGFFDENVKNGGPRPASRRRRQDYSDVEGEDYGEDYYEDEAMFDIDWAGEEGDDYTGDAGDAGEAKSDTDDYWGYFAEYMDDYAEVTVSSDSTTDEDNGAVRTVLDLKKLEERAFSKDPARAHRQIVNAMKQYTKRFLDDCSNSPQKLKRLTKVYRETAKLHELILDTVAEKYRRLDERAARQAQRV